MSVEDRDIHGTRGGSKEEERSSHREKQDQPIKDGRKSILWTSWD